MVDMSKSNGRNVDDDGAEKCFFLLLMLNSYPVTRDSSPGVVRLFTDVKKERMRENHYDLIPLYMIYGQQTVISILLLSGKDISKEIQYNFLFVITLWL